MQEKGRNKMLGQDPPKQVKTKEQKDPKSGDRDKKKPSGSK